jgi:hypothetical protein
LGRTHQEESEGVEDETHAKSMAKVKQHLTFHNYNSTIIEEHPEDESLEVPAQAKRSSVPK